MRERRIEGGVSYLLESLSRQCTATRMLSGSSNKVICFSLEDPLRVRKRVWFQHCWLLNTITLNSRGLSLDADRSTLLQGKGLGPKLDFHNTHLRTRTLRFSLIKRESSSNEKLSLHQNLFFGSVFSSV